MGVPVFDTDDMFSDEDSNTTCTCSCTSCNTSSSLSSENTSSSHYMDSTAYQDIVGNCKKISMDDNTNNLRIVGNNNRIRITINTGDLIVIGNNTRLKIEQNHGRIKYTGNDGRISLGYKSQQRMVDYIGCNGILKICHSNQSKTSGETKVKCTKEKVNSNDCENHKNGNKNSCHQPEEQKLYCHLPSEENKTTTNKNKKTTESAKTTTTKVGFGKSKEKSHSYSGQTKLHHDQWHTFNQIFSEANRKSMPNLSGYHYVPSAVGNCSREQPSSIIQSLGNIVIANASNICIAPYVRNITAKA